MTTKTNPLRAEVVKEAVANADAHLNNACVPTYTEIVDALVEMDTALWSDCRIPGDLRDQLRALHHNVVGRAKRAMSGEE